MENKYKLIVHNLQMIRFLLKESSTLYELDNYIDNKVCDCLEIIKEIKT